MNQHNTLFRIATRLAAPLPTWAEYESAPADQKTEIRRQWRNANTDAASKLSIRAGQREAAERMQAHEAKTGAWAAARVAWLKLNAPWELKYPPGTFRDADDGLDRDTMTAFATGDGWAANTNAKRRK